MDTGHELLIHSWVGLISTNCGLTTTHQDAILRLLLLLLLDNRLDESGLVVQVNSVLVLEVVHVIVKECFVVAELLSDRQDINLVDRGLSTHRFQ